MSSMSHIRPAIAFFCLFLNVPFAGATSTSEAVTVPSKLMKQLKSFEPSGLVYLPDLQRYLISSDDTDKKDTPWVFLMDEQGQIDKNPILIKGIQEMTDIESISVDNNGLIYFMSSLGLNKSGESIASRNLFVQAERDFRSIEARHSIELRSLLISAIQNSTLPELKAISGNLEKDLDIESHFVLDGILYVGLKNPQPSFGQALILDLGRVGDIFNSQEILQIKIWKKVNFSILSGKENTLSEMTLTDQALLLSSTSEVGDGALWKLDLAINKLELLKEFSSLKPEGLAYRSNENDLMIVFDQGDRAGRFLRHTGMF